MALQPITLENVEKVWQWDELLGDNTPVTSVEFRNNENVVAYGTMGGHTFLFSFEDLSKADLEYNSGEIVDVAFNPSLDYLASARPVLEALVWETNPPDWYALYRTGDSVLTVVFSPDGRTLAYGGEDDIQVSDIERMPGGGLISLVRMDLDSMHPEASNRIREDTGQINSLDFNPAGTLIAAGIGGGNSIEAGGRIKIWDVETRTLQLTLEGHTGAVNDAKFSPTGHTLASASADHTVRLWDVTSGQSIMTFEGHTDAVNAVAFSPDNTLLASASTDGTVRFWNIATGEEVMLLDVNFVNDNQPTPVWDVDFNWDGRMVVTAAEDGLVRMWGYVQ